VRPEPAVKEPHLAGRWYPAEPAALEAIVRELLAAGDLPRPGVKAILVPHGPYRSSGPVAASAFAAVAGSARRVIIVSPTHFADFHGAATLPMRAYRTPLGSVELDGERATAFGRLPFVRANPAVFLREHGLEVQLPLLQATLPGARTALLLLGSLEPGEVAALAEALRPMLDDDTLLVVSSDLVHYGRRFGFLPVPASDASTVAAALRRLDDEVLVRIVARDADGFVRWLAETGAVICGRHAIEVLLRALPAGVCGERLAHASSLDADGFYEHVVGYAAVAFGPAPA
jgi:MEMO1 family protein